MPLLPIKMRLQPLKARNFSHVPQDDNHLYNMMQRRHSLDKDRSRGPNCSRNLVNLTDPIERVKAYHKRDMDENAELERRMRWNLMDSEGNKIKLGTSRPEQPPHPSIVSVKNRSG